MDSKEVSSYIAGVVALAMTIVLLRGRVPDAVAFTLGAWVMLLVGYPATRYFAGNQRLSFARWAVYSTLGAVVAIALVALWK